MIKHHLQAYVIKYFILIFVFCLTGVARGHVADGEGTHGAEKMELAAAIDVLAQRYGIGIKGLSRVPRKTVTIDHGDSVHQLAFLLLELSYVMLYGSEGGIEKIIILGGAARLEGGKAPRIRPSSEDAALSRALLSTDGEMTRVNGWCVKCVSRRV